MEKEQSKLNISRNIEFKITVSTENIDKIDEQIRNMKNDSKNDHKESKIRALERNTMTETQINQNVSSGVILLNTCNNCDSRFKPKNSMIDEPLCGFCLEKNKING